MAYYNPTFTKGQVLQADDLNNLAEGNPYSRFKGKIISIIGDSASTYEGYTPVADGHNLKHRNRYPDGAPDWVGTVNDTWWMRTINLLEAKLGVNSSWAGSCVVNTSATNTGDVGPDACISSTTRITGLGANGTPDIIWVLAGGNDMGRNTTLGSFDKTKAHSVNLTNNVITNFADAYTQLIMRLQYYYPKAKIVAILQHPCKTYVTWQNIEKYGNVIKDICSYFGIEVVDFRKCGFNHNNIAEYDLKDGIHPNAKGFKVMSDYLYSKITSLMFLEQGESITYSITNNLVNVVNNDRYIKAVRENEPYNATLSTTSGSLSSISITMNGNNITKSCYDDSTGKISIASVTGNIIIDESTETIEITGLSNGMEGSTLEYSMLEMPTLKVNFIPSNTTQKGLTWVSKNTNVAEVDSTGKVTFLNTGTVEIVAASQYNNAYSVSWDITVVDAGDRITANSKATPIPSTATAVTNLATVLTSIDGSYYLSSGWGAAETTSCITFPVLAGDRINSTAFSSISVNESTVNGTRTTFLLDDTIVDSKAPADIYAEYTANGYVTVPSGCNCVSIPFTTAHKPNLEIYLLTLPNPT